MPTTIPEALLRGARRMADAARNDGLAESGPVRVVLAIETIERVAELCSTAMNATDAAFLKLILSASQQQLKLYAVTGRKKV